MGCIKASDYEALTGGSGVILGTYTGVNASGDCVEDCGLCCVTTCPSDLTTYEITPEYDENDPTTWCSYQTLIPLGPILYSETLYNNQGVGCSVNGNDFVAFSLSTNTNSFGVDENGLIIPPELYTQTYCPIDFPEGMRDEFYDGLSIYRSYGLTKYNAPQTPPTLGLGTTWADGYPSGTYFIETITNEAVIYNGYSLFGYPTVYGYQINDICDTQITEDTDADTASTLYLRYEKRTQKYFQCIDGVLIDKTSEALVPVPVSGGHRGGTEQSFGQIPFGIECTGSTSENLGTSISYESYETNVESQCYDQMGGLCGTPVTDSTAFGFQQGFWGECGYWIDDETGWEIPTCDQWDADPSLGNFYAICVDDPRYEEIYAPYTFATDQNIGVFESPFKPGLYWPATAKCGSQPYVIWTSYLGTDFLTGSPITMPECSKTFYPSLTELGTEGITSLGFTCNDTISKSGCISGGVLTPTGVALGTWFTGLDCEIANSVYGGCSGLMNL